MGLHPWHVHKENWERKISIIDQALLRPNVIAVGETGLDKAVDIHYGLQQKAFMAQIGLAEAHRKPMIIHCVRSYSEILAYRKRADQSLPWIFHWFNAHQQTASALMSKNCYLSFGPMLFQEQSKAFSIFQWVPPGRIFLETDDAGFSIREVYTRAAALRNMPLDDLKAQIMDNFNRCFQQ